MRLPLRFGDDFALLVVGFFQLRKAQLDVKGERLSKGGTAFADWGDFGFDWEVVGTER